MLLCLSRELKALRVASSLESKLLKVWVRLSLTSKIFYWAYKLELRLVPSLERIATSLSKSLFLPFFVQCSLEIRFSLNKGPLSHSTLSLSLSLLLTLFATSNIFCPGRVCVSLLPWLNLLFVLKRKRIGILAQKGLSWCSSDSLWIEK